MSDSSVDILKRLEQIEAVQQQILSLLRGDSRPDGLSDLDACLIAGADDPLEAIRAHNESRGHRRGGRRRNK